MTLSAETVIRFVRDKHPGFDKSRVPDALLLRELSSYQRTLAALVQERNPDYLDATQNIAYAASLLTAGAALPAHKMVKGGRVIFTSSDIEPVELTLQGSAHRFYPIGRYPAVVKGQKIYLLGTENDWSIVASVDVDYVPLYTDLSALASTFTLPDNAQEALVAWGAFFSASRVAALKDSPPVSVREFADRSQRQETLYLNEVGQQRTAQISQVIEGY